METGLDSAEERVFEFQGDSKLPEVWLQLQFATKHFWFEGKMFRCHFIYFTNFTFLVAI